MPVMTMPAGWRGRRAVTALATALIASLCLVVVDPLGAGAAPSTALADIFYINNVNDSWQSGYGYAPCLFDDDGWPIGDCATPSWVIAPDLGYHGQFGVTRYTVVGDGYDATGFS